MKNTILAILLAAIASAAMAQSTPVIINDPNGSLKFCMFTPAVGTSIRVVCD